MQASIRSPIQKGGAYCAVLLTQNKVYDITDDISIIIINVINQIHVLKEDWTNGTIQLVTSISVQDVNKVCVEHSLPVYCTLVSIREREREREGECNSVCIVLQSYDDWENESPGMWMLCFSSEYELGQFEQCLLKKYKEIFQVMIYKLYTS